MGIKEIQTKPQMAVFEYRHYGMALEHNYYCSVCRENSAVISRGILQPCRDCQKKSYHTVKLNWIGKLLIPMLDKIH
jgi:hypothetical protein